MPRSSVARHEMPRTPSNNSLRIALRVPPEWGERVDALIPKMRRTGELLTAADAWRMALAKGIDQLEAEHGEKEKRRK